MEVQRCSKCCPDEGVMMEACGVLIVFGKNIARANMQLRERRVFWFVSAATRVLNWQKS
jgi:hypothetical protein